MRTRWLVAMLALPIIVGLVVWPTKRPAVEKLAHRAELIMRSAATPIIGPPVIREEEPIPANLATIQSADPPSPQALEAAADAADAAARAASQIPAQN